MRVELEIGEEVDVVAFTGAVGVAAEVAFALVVVLVALVVVLVALVVVLFPAAARAWCMVKAGITATPNKIIIKRNPLS
jgi:hypothetical protein